VYCVDSLVIRGVYGVVFSLIKACELCSIPCDYRVYMVQCSVSLWGVYGIVICLIMGCVWCSVLFD